MKRSMSTAPAATVAVPSGDRSVGRRRAGIVTPEAVLLEFEHGRRRVADARPSLIDVLSLACVAVLAIAVVGAVVADESAPPAAVARRAVGGFLALFGYPAVAETLWRGARWARRRSACGS